MIVTTDTRHLTASALVIDRQVGKVLLMHHRASGLWQFPGGHVDPDESPDETAVREVKEETGISVRLLRRSTAILPVGVTRPVPWAVTEFPAPAKPAKAEPAHSHIDLLYLATPASFENVHWSEREAYGAGWFTYTEARALPARGEVFVQTMDAFRALREGDWH